MDEYESDGVQYDTFYAPSAAQLEAEALRREAVADEQARASRGQRDNVLVTRPY
jgi:hypothetical protein